MTANPEILLRRKYYWQIFQSQGIFTEKNQAFFSLKPQKQSSKEALGEHPETGVEINRKLAFKIGMV